MIDKSSHNCVFAEDLGQVTQFCFDESVASIFPDMIKRSVPGYSTILSMIGDISRRYTQDNSYCYDLGCSLGAATLAMRHAVIANNCRIISVDNSTAMVERCRYAIATDKQNIPVDIYCMDIQNLDIEKASIIVLNFTLQFIKPERRERILQHVYEGLLPGGILIISEKIYFDNILHQKLMTEFYYNFKRLNGYSDLEIEQKRTSLSNVLYPDTIETHRQRLKCCGFSSIDIWFQCFTFCSLIAIK